MEVIILAGGLGTRLRSEVQDVPKCMAPISDKPFLWYLLKYLSKYERINRVILSVGYLCDVIIQWVKSIQDQFKFVIEYTIEEEPLGTGGAIKIAMSKLKEEKAIIINGDTYFDINLDEIFRRHEINNNSKLTIALKPMIDFDRYGTVDCDENEKIINFNEKQPCKNGNINGGIYVLDKDEMIFKGYPKKFSFENTILNEMCGKYGCVYGFVTDEYFIDIGVPEDYHKAEIDLPKYFS